MRIKDLTSRVTKLLTGNAWFVVDNGTKVEKVAYSEVVKQGIEDYAGSTLAGSAQTVKSAINALNSKQWSVQSSYTGGDILEYIKLLSNGTYFTRIDNVQGFPVTGGVIYRINKTNGVNDTRCAILAIPMNTSSPDIYTAFVGQNATSITWNKAVKQSEMDNVKTTEHPNITDVLTPAEDITISHSYVSVRNGLVILDCHFSQTSTTKTDRFTFKTGYKPIVTSTNISPIFMYSNNAVSNTVFFVNSTTLTMFGASPVANQEYYFRMIYFNE